MTTDATALENHHRSLEEWVQSLERVDVEQHGSTTFTPEELHDAASSLSEAASLSEASVPLIILLQNT